MKENGIYYIEGIIAISEYVADAVPTKSLKPATNNPAQNRKSWTK